MRKLIFSSQARDDLAEIAAYIARDKPIAARNFVRKLRDHFKKLKARPWIGEECTEFSSRAYRRTVVQNYIIVYEVDDSSVRIARVIHAARDWPKLLE